MWLDAAAGAKSLQSCPTLWNPIDGSPPGSPIPEILQARTLEWVAISFSNAWKWKVKVKSLSRVRLLETPWISAQQAPPSMLVPFKWLNCIDGKKKLFLGYCPKQTQLPFNLSPFKGLAKKDAGFWQNSTLSDFLIPTSTKIYCLKFLLIFLSL